MQPTDPFRMIITGLGVCLVASLSAVLSYISVGWEPLDAVYMVVITLFGVGYGEVQPLSDPIVKLQTIVLILVGCSSFLYTIGGFFQLVAEGEIRRFMGLHRMSRGIKRMKNHTIICGFGRVGKHLAEDLASQKIPFVVVDTNQSRVTEAEDAGYAVVAGDASYDDTLFDAGILRAKSLATVLPNDAINVFITLSARDLHSEIEIIARAECPQTERKLLRSGANHVIMPATIGAARMAEIIFETTGSAKRIDEKKLPRNPARITAGNALSAERPSDTGTANGETRQHHAISTDPSLASSANNEGESEDEELLSVSDSLKEIGDLLKNAEVNQDTSVNDHVAVSR